MRIGQGFDVHQLVEGRRLIIGGVDIPYEKGLLGHSDADVLLHAICDALLGAAALGDIGAHFPDGDPAFRGIDSLELLRRTAAPAGPRSRSTPACSPRPPASARTGTRCARRSPAPSGSRSRTSAS